MQQLRGWSALDTGLAIFPAGLLVVLLSPAVMPLIGRFGPMRLIALGLLANAGAYALFARIGLGSTYVPAVLPTVLLAGIGFALSFGPLNVAGTTGVAAAEQGLAGGLLNTSFQFGGALVLAVVTAVNNAYTGGPTPQGLLDGFHPALVVSVIAAVAGAAAVGLGRSRPAEEVVEAEVAEAEAA
jgi:sugar phosphate permease